MEARLAKVAEVEEEVGSGAMAMAALQSQIAELRAWIAHLEETQAKAEVGVLAARLAVVERGVGILTAIVGELHSNTARSDIAGLVAELRKLAPPPAPAATEEVKRAA